MQTRRSFLLGLTLGVVAFCVVAVPLVAAELLGTVKSVDADNNKFVVTGENGKDVTVTVSSDTVYENAKTGKVSKKFTLNRLNPGGMVTVTHEDGKASKVLLGKGAAKKKDAP
jgi:hypothetical protein